MEQSNLAWVEVNPNVWKPEAIEDYIIGILIKVEPKVTGLSTKYYLETKDKGTVLVWGSAILDDRLKLIDLGSIVKITYKGEKPSKVGKNPLHIYKVEKAVSKGF